MRRFKLVGIVALAGIVGVTLFLGIPLLGSNAGVSHAQGQGATVIKDFSCIIIPADWYGSSTLVTTDTHSVVTKSGNTAMYCKFDIPAGMEPAKAVKITGFNCGTYLGMTQDSMSVSTPGGKVMLRCLIKHNK